MEQLCGITLPTRAFYALSPLSHGSWSERRAKVERGGERRQREGERGKLVVG